MRMCNLSSIVQKNLRICTVCDSVPPTSIRPWMTRSLLMLPTSVLFYLKIDRTNISVLHLILINTFHLYKVISMSSL
ncbi:hypothetical protein RvY_06819 [Ramazzottius varieornatus]|uniref:Uncharacterized protein n=1 Tax=Ramazzottius varieornatus TaxID=947166 RepID=A0A1D1UZU1_RAMVA|nr:hypothetical protein RvY_06819 [Ramazzottius varieornatus]